MQKSAARLNQKSLEILEGNLVLLHNHPEGHNKIQDKYKSEKLLNSLQDNYVGAHVPSFNPKLINMKTPPISHLKPLTQKEDLQCIP